MANQRDIKRRIASVKNTRKITSTMEMVASSKMKKTSERLAQSKPFEERVNGVISNLMAAGFSTISHPLFRSVPNPSRVLILQITSNRGLCGGYNTHVIENTIKFKEQLESEGKEVLLYVMGKKATSYFKFIKVDIQKEMVNLEDSFSFEDAAALGEELTKVFTGGEVQEVYISYTKVHSNTNQKPDMLKLLPITPDMEIDSDEIPNASLDYVFEPEPAKIFSYILPLYLKVRLLTCFLESSYSEHFARRVAMKNATDAAKEMIRDLNITYNRVRQDKITTEISEIVGGAAALE